MSERFNLPQHTHARWMNLSLAVIVSCLYQIIHLTLSRSSRRSLVLARCSIVTLMFKQNLRIRLYKYSFERGKSHSLLFAP